MTWNGRGFDLPVLALRSLRHGLSWPWYYRERDYRYRYSEEGHLDLGDFLADHGAARMTSLDGAARLIGLPGKEGMDGSQVEGLWNTGQIDALRRYCLSDVAQTAFLFLRQRLLVGQLDRVALPPGGGGLAGGGGRRPPPARLAARVDRQRLLLAAGLNRFRPSGAPAGELGSRWRRTSSAASADQRLGHPREHEPGQRRVDAEGRLILQARAAVLGEETPAAPPSRSPPRPPRRSSRR